MEATELVGRIRQTLNQAGIKSVVEGEGKHGNYKVFRSGYQIFNIIGFVTVRWIIASKYLASNSDCSTEYRTNNELILLVLQAANFHVFRSGTSIEVCCLNVGHDIHAICRKQSKAAKEDRRQLEINRAQAAYLKKS